VLCREYTELENKIARSLRETRLNAVPGFLDVAIQKFTRYHDIFLQIYRIYCIIIKLFLNHVTIVFSSNQGEFQTELIVFVEKEQYCTGTFMYGLLLARTRVIVFVDKI
jgi:hypothetical protein